MAVTMRSTALVDQDKPHIVMTAAGGRPFQASKSSGSLRVFQMDSHGRLDPAVDMLTRGQQPAIGPKCKRPDAVGPDPYMPTKVMTHVAHAIGNAEAERIARWCGAHAGQTDLQRAVAQHAGLGQDTLWCPM